MSLVSFRGVKRAFGSVWALDGVDLEIEEGTAFGLVGRNGAGKTTLIRMIPALLHATEGEVRVFGMDPWDKQEEVKIQMGYLSEGDSFPPQVKVRDLVDLHAEVYPGWNTDMAGKLMDDFSLDPMKRMGKLSTGQQRQVGLICAICHNPRLLVLDEPAGSLDPVARREFLEVVIGLLLDSGSTIVFSSHQFADVERLADRVGILHEGKILADRPLDAYREDSCRALVRGADVDKNKLRGIQGCVRVQEREDGKSLTFTVNETKARESIASSLGAEAEIEFQSTNLEDLFIDWTGY
ncbi:MAG: ABC transporter ATP-binding protein [Deltaproteobacteria bacterium]|nr:ABC transporter ATP-binding protein [Deltaproteobacteria bacterium]